MEKHYLFLCSAPINEAYFRAALKELGVVESTIEFVDPTYGEFKAEAKLSSKLDDAIQNWHNDLGVTFAVLCTHQRTAFEEKLVKNAIRYLPNQCVYPTDVIMREISFGDFSSYGPLVRLFKDVPKELLLVAGTYLRCGLDACAGAEKLGVHRNTFNYRLNTFVHKTKLDIRDYHNALLLELFFDLGGDRM